MLERGLVGLARDRDVELDLRCAERQVEAIEPRLIATELSVGIEARYLEREGGAHPAQM